jgi:hypothetical protein
VIDKVKLETLRVFSKNKTVLCKDKKKGKFFIFASVYQTSYLEAGSELLKKGKYFEKC